MAASEVAIVASHVAAVAAQAPVTGASQAWFAIIGTGFGALITAGTSLLSQYLRQRAEQQKLAAQRAPAQLDAALMLEAFARQAVAYLDAWDARFTDWLVEQHGEQVGQPRPWTSLTFDLTHVEDWSAVPIEILSQCRELPLALAESSSWVGSAHDEWADFPDLHWLDSQRATLFGLQAGELAAKIRVMIAAPASSLATDSFNRLQREFDEYKSKYVEKHGKLELIPDLKARLQRECPDVARSDSLAPPTAATLDGVA